jgi:hypothetical protein
MTEPSPHNLVRVTKEERLKQFVELVALLTLAGEPGEDGKPFEPTDEDNADTVGNLIATARELLDQLYPKKEDQPCTE